MEAKPKTIGAVYRDEAAELMAAAARSTAEPARPTQPHPKRRPPPPLVTPEARRPLPYREPLGVNDNPPIRDLSIPRREFDLPRLLARIAIAPLYIAVLIAMVAVIVLFVRGFLAA